MSAPIVSVRVERIERPFVMPFRNAKVRYDTLSYVRVAVTCEGMVGWGEMTAMPGYSAETVASMVEAVSRYYRPAIHGLNLLAEREIEQAVDRALPGNPYARSALELALWDLRGKLLDVPVHELIGGALRQNVPIGAIVPLDTPEAMADNAKGWRERGAATFQVKIAVDAKSSASRIRAVREVVGNEATIAVDGNGSFGILEALRTMDAIAPYDVAFFEQPVAIRDLDAMAAVTRRGAVPVVADECLVTAYDALEIVRRGAAHGFNLKLAKSGIAETRRIIAIADAAGIPYGLGSMLETNFGTLAGIHMASTLHNPLFSAELIGPWMIHEDASGEPPLLEAEAFAWRVPNGPGWGAAPDEKTAGA